MNRFLSILALVGLTLAATVHVASLAGIDVSERVPFVWVLHVGVFIVFVPFVLSSRKALGAKPSISDIRALMPNWVILVGAAVFAYAALRACASFSNASAGDRGRCCSGDGCRSGSGRVGSLSFGSVHHAFGSRLGLISGVGRAACGAWRVFCSRMTRFAPSPSGRSPPCSPVRRREASSPSSGRACPATAGRSFPVGKPSAVAPVGSGRGACPSSKRGRRAASIGRPSEHHPPNSRRQNEGRAVSAGGCC